MPKMTLQAFIHKCKEYKLSSDCSVEDVEKLRKSKAKTDHPDLYPEPDKKELADDIFKQFNSDCDYLIAYIRKHQSNKKSYNAATDSTGAKYHMVFSPRLLSDPEFVELYNQHLQWCLQYRPSTDEAKKSWADRYQPYEDRAIEKQKRARQERIRQEREREAEEKRREETKKQYEQDQARERQRKREEEIQKVRDEQLVQLKTSLKEYQKKLSDWNTNHAHFYVHDALNLFDKIKLATRLLLQLNYSAEDLQEVELCCHNLEQQCVMSRSETARLSNVTYAKLNSSSTGVDSTGGAIIGAFVGGLIGVFGGVGGVLAGASIGGAIGAGTATTGETFTEAERTAMQKEQTLLSERLRKWSDLIADISTFRQSVSSPSVRR